MTIFVTRQLRVTVDSIRQNSWREQQLAKLGESIWSKLTKSEGEMEAEKTSVDS